MRIRLYLHIMLGSRVFSRVWSRLMLKDLRLKCCIIGDQNCGKTSVLHTYIHSKVLPETQTTLGIDFHTKTLLYGSNRLRLTVWDTAGSERFRSLMHSYLRDSDIIIVMYDLSKREHHLPYWLRIAEQHTPNVLGLLGNKNDLTQNCTNDLRDVLAPYERQNLNIVRGVSSSRDIDSVKNFFHNCVKMSIENCRAPPKLSTVRIKDIKQDDSSKNPCCS